MVSFLVLAIATALRSGRTRSESGEIARDEGWAGQFRFPSLQNLLGLLGGQLLQASLDRLGGLLVLEPLDDGGRSEVCQISLWSNEVVIDQETHLVQLPRLDQVPRERLRGASEPSH
jgi:hypothetical protein